MKSGFYHSKIVDLVTAFNRMKKEEAAKGRKEGSK